MVLHIDERRIASYPEQSNNHQPLRILEKQNMTFALGMPTITH